MDNLFNEPTYTNFLIYKSPTSKKKSLKNITHSLKYLKTYLYNLYFYHQLKLWTKYLHKTSPNARSSYPPNFSESCRWGYSEWNEFKIWYFNCDQDSVKLFYKIYCHYALTYIRGHGHKTNNSNFSCFLFLRPKKKPLKNHNKKLQIFQTVLFCFLEIKKK